MLIGLVVYLAIGFVLAVVLTVIGRHERGLVVGFLVVLLLWPAPLAVLVVEWLRR